MHNQLMWNKGNYISQPLIPNTLTLIFQHIHTNAHTHTATQLLSVSGSHLQTHIMDRIR